ncbi:glycosyltransferase family 4 protein [Ulvibacterium sp.]|uniref:glycosyltransferase family 4 protein n=1 Tax=Ulvibacterium sp. TaxID=2665914 RepID=UPI003CC6B35D
MKITWVTRNFLDYRIPVFEAINKNSNNNLTLVYNSDVVPDRCITKINQVLGERAIGLSGELSIGNKHDDLEFANTTLRVPIQKGLIKTVKKTKPDIILADGFFQWTYAAYWLKIFYKIPLIMLYERTFHTERIAPWWRTGLRRIASRYIDKIGCNGRLTFEYVEKGIKFPKEKLFLGNMAADTFGLEKEVSVHRQTKKNKREIKDLTILYVGRLIELKGVREMLLVWKDFIKEDMNVRLKIVGGGDQEEYLRELVEEEGIQKVQIVGGIDYSEVSKMYAFADVFIIPTLEDNWSLVVPEAMSCGLPILCSKYNGCWPELVTSKNGWVFDPLDSHNFLKILNSAWESRKHWKEMGESSLQIVSDFTPQKIGDRIYKAILTTIE